MKKILIGIALLFITSPAFGMMFPHPNTDPAVSTLAKRAQDDGGQIVDLEYVNKLTKLVKQLGVWGNVKFLGDANMGVKLNSGVSVATLYDLSGNDNDAAQATAGNQPVWTANVQGGRYGMVFDGSNDVLPTGQNSFEITDSTGTYMIIVYKRLAETTDRYPMGIHRGAGVHGESRLLIFTTGNCTLSTYYHDYSAGSDIGAAMVLQEAVLGTDASTATIYKNGTVLGTGALSDLAVSVNAADVLGIGARGDGVANMNSSILFAAVFNVVPTTAQRQAIEGFINAYYQIY